MKTKLLAAAVAAGWFGLAGAGAAVAATTVSFTPFGTPSVSDSAVTIWGSEPTPAGEDLVTAQGDGTLSFPSNEFTLTGSAEVVQGQYSNSAAPQLTSLAKDTAPYLSVLGGENATLTTPGVSELEIYIGSLDGYNSLTFNLAGGGPETFGGDALVAATLGSGSRDDGNQSAGASNGLYVFNFGGDALNSIFFSSTTNSFEIANIYVPSAEIQGNPVPLPEPATWLMMVMGMAAIGAGLRMGRDRKLVDA